MDGDWAVFRGASFGGGADDFPLAAEAGDDAALGRDFLLTTHVDHDFFGFVLIVELIHELAGVRHHRVGPPPNLRVICAFFAIGVRGCVGMVGQWVTGDEDETQRRRGRRDPRRRGVATRWAGG